MNNEYHLLTLKVVTPPPPLLHNHLLISLHNNETELLLNG